MLIDDNVQQNDDDNLENDDEMHTTSSIYAPSNPKFWMCLLSAGLLIMMAAICSGMTVGYLSIDELKLEVKLSEGTTDEKR